MIHSDPHAEGFHVAMGEVPSGSVAGRVLPLLRIALS